LKNINASEITAEYKTSSVIINQNISDDYSYAYTVHPGFCGGHPHLSSSNDSSSSFCPLFARRPRLASLQAIPDKRPWYVLLPCQPHHQTEVPLMAPQAILTSHPDVRIRGLFRD